MAIQSPVLGDGTLHSTVAAAIGVIMAATPDSVTVAMPAAGGAAIAARDAATQDALTATSAVNARARRDMVRAHHSLRHAEIGAAKAASAAVATVMWGLGAESPRAASTAANSTLRQVLTGAQCVRLTRIPRWFERGLAQRGGDS